MSIFSKLSIWITDFLIKIDNFYSTFFENFTENLNSKIQRFGKKMKKSLCNLENNLRTKNCIILTNSDKKSLKILKNTKISTAGNIILAKCGLEFCIEFVKFSFTAAFHIVFLLNLVNLKKHRLRLGILELKFFEFPALRQYFFVVGNFRTEVHKKNFRKWKKLRRRVKIN